MAETTTLAVCGKGGVGKTTISALMIRLLARSGTRKILAIDADPAVGLATALGVHVKKTVDDIRRDLIERIREGESQPRTETLKLLDYEIFEALQEQNGYVLLAIGRPEDEGCYCRVNSLLKEIIQDLAGNFDIVLIDGEAGVEQINRRVMKSVDHLILVSDTSAKGISVAQTIAHVAKDNRAVDFSSMGLILNRVKYDHEIQEIRSRTDLAVLGWISDEDLIRDCDFRGLPLFTIPETSHALNVISGILEHLSI